MNDNIFTVRPNPLREMRSEWWRYALAGLLLFWGLPYKTDFPAVCAIFLIPVLVYKFLIWRSWSTSVHSDGLNIRQPLKRLRKVSWRDIKSAEVVDHEFTPYISLTVVGQEKSVFIPLPGSTVELKNLLFKFAGPENPITKAVSREQPN